MPENKKPKRKRVVPQDAKPRKRISPREAARMITTNFQKPLEGVTKAVYNSKHSAPEFKGYKARIGTMPDETGRLWQIQIHALVHKEDHLRKDELVPMLAGRKAWLIRFRIHLKTIIDSIFA